MKDTSGYAFPVSDHMRVGEIEIDRSHDGMTLRDYFAGQTLMGILANQRLAYDTVEDHDIARCAYLMADAMIKRRSEDEEI
jgi:hypothetical protein